MSLVQEVAKGATMWAAEMLCKDASYIPKEKLDWHPAENGSSVIEILTQVVDGNAALGAAIKGGTAGESVKGLSFEALKDRVMSSSKEVCEAIDSYRESALMSDITMPWGMVMPASAAIMLCASHMSYHDGQINYMQLLIGDTKFHWMEG